MNKKQFVRSHMATMCVADFPTSDGWMMRGLLRYHVFDIDRQAPSKGYGDHGACTLRIPKRLEGCKEIPLAGLDIQQVGTQHDQDNARNGDEPEKLRGNQRRRDKYE
jgi:hypothetical protein